MKTKFAYDGTRRMEWNGMQEYFPMHTLNQA